MVKKGKISFNIYHTFNLILFGIKNKAKIVRIRRNIFNIKLTYFLFHRSLIVDFKLEENFILIFLNQTNTSQSFYNSFKFISKPSKRVYLSYIQLKKMFFYESVFGLVLTDYGLLSIFECLKYRIGGELLIILK